MISKYTITTIDGYDYVSLTDAKRILGVKSAKDLRSLGVCTVTIGNGKPVWDLGWVIGKTKLKLPPNLFQPDYEWIREYEAARRVARKAKVRKPITPVASKRGVDLTSSARLKELVKIMPPPKSVPCKDVDWSAVEKAVGVKYPKSYKEFIAVYGGLNWFDEFQPLVPFENMTPKGFRDFLDQVFDGEFDGDTVDGKGKLVDTPRFGNPGGLLPFMTGSSGHVYAWITTGPSRRWTVISVTNQQVQVLPPISITEMFLTWFLNEHVMDEVWGTIDEFREHSADRLCLL